MRIFTGVLGLAVVGAIGAWVLSAPRPLPDGATAGLVGEATRGEAVFHAAGCASCHMAPGSTGAAQLVLAGGQSFPSAFGTFVAPNISPSEAGIGGWTLAQFANAVQRGVSVLAERRREGPITEEQRRNMFGAAPDLDVAFDNEDDRNSARNFMELMERAQEE